MIFGTQLDIFYLHLSEEQVSGKLWHLNQEVSKKIFKTKKQSIQCNIIHT